ncbi:hypothetical protein CHK_0105 [Christensenella hongkongensis]|uniref:Uncharacterized protein n=1 Tax=Christensenella hongkongensis TaxID=270498 RepID=A0A0M2NJM9_9FIRM|nr:hypothetical protein CHK_0105 [Christensenella hongkongensis]
MHLRPEFRNFRKKFFNKITKRVRQPASHLNEIAHFNAREKNIKKTP